VDRPAIPDDLFRRPVEPPAAADDLFRRPDPDATAVRPVPPPPVSPPVWSYQPGSPEADLLPSERSYASAPLAPVRPARGNFSGARGVIIILAVLVVAAIAGGILWFSGGGAPTTGQSPSTKASATTTPKGGKASTSASAAQSASVTPSTTPSDAFPPTGATLCSGSTTVAVNASTSCEFAANVAAAIPSDATGSFTVTANSPVTQKDYQMACVKGTYTVCTGGQNALVYVK